MPASSSSGRRIWHPEKQPNGWRAVSGVVVDGRLFATEVDCAVYCRALNAGEDDD